VWEKGLGKGKMNNQREDLDRHGNEGFMTAGGQRGRGSRNCVNLLCQECHNQRGSQCNDGSKCIHGRFWRTCIGIGRVTTMATGLWRK